MSDDESDISPVPEFKNILWIKTFYYYVRPDEDNRIRNSNIIWESEPNKLPFINVFLQFQFMQLTEDTIRLTCVKTIPSSVPEHIKRDYGYNFQFHCFISIVDKIDPVIFDMLGERTIAYETIHLNDLYEYQPFEAKILVKMIEYDILPNNEFLIQEAKLLEKKLKYFNYSSMLKELCYILQVSMVQDIFTGRQDSEFASLKLSYIKNTALFSAHISDYLRALEEHVDPPLTNLSLILNYILHGKRAVITSKDLIKAYLHAHHMGLEFFANLSRDCILGRTVDLNLVVDALFAADEVNDEVLFRRMAEVFESSESSEKWSKVSEYSIIKFRFVKYSLRRLDKKELLQQAGEGISTPGFFKLL